MKIILEGSEGKIKAFIKEFNLRFKKDGIKNIEFKKKKESKKTDSKSKKIND